jgi:hypothetical protein
MYSLFVKSESYVEIQATHLPFLHTRGKQPQLMPLPDSDEKDNSALRTQNASKSFHDSEYVCIIIWNTCTRVRATSSFYGGLVGHCFSPVEC